MVAGLILYSLSDTATGPLEDELLEPSLFAIAMTAIAAIRNAVTAVSAPNTLRTVRSWSRAIGLLTVGASAGGYAPDTPKGVGLAMKSVGESVGSEGVLGPVLG